MTGRRKSMVLTAALAIACLLAAGGNQAAAGPEPQSPEFFEQHIQPIFAENCLACHGPDEARSGLRLSDRLAAFEPAESGEPAITPGNAEASELIRRVTHDDARKRMPPEGDPLTDEQVALLGRWIDAGAEWAEHWAYREIARPQPPAVANGDRVRHPIDAFVLAKLQQEGVAPSNEADRYTLIRRLYYDLIGLPPTPEQVDAFVQDESADAYERVVDELLASPHFGERWGRHWLDKARYADSDGYEKDNPRPDAYLYRDWVIDAINDDMPLDQFTVEQLAGDLLPEATEYQHLATAFHRQTLTNTEGGTDQEEFRVAAVVDRTNTTGAIWLGLTVACAECHTHKYDRLTHEEYFGLYAFFNSWDETTRPVPRSAAEMEQYEQAAAEHERLVAEARAAYAAHRQSLADGLDAWAAERAEEVAAGQHAVPVTLEPVELRSEQGVSLETLDDGSVLAAGPNPASDTYTVIARVEAERLAGLKLEAMTHDALPSRGPGRIDHGNFVLSELRVFVADSAAAAAGDAAEPVDLHNATATHAQDGWPVADAIDGDESTGWAIMPRAGESHTARFALVEPRAVEQGGDLYVRIELSQQYGRQHTLGRFRLAALPSEGELLPAEVGEALAVAAPERREAQRQTLLDYRLTLDERGRELHDRVTELQEQAPTPPLMDVRILAERAEPRETRLHERGDFLAPAGRVERHTPAVLHELEPRDPEHGPDRLDLAHWLMDEANPLTPRVLANHLWLRLFGEGLVATVDDFGVRGERPSHPDLLDWLATEYRERGWSRKAMIRLIVTSSIYRQESTHRSDMIDIDPLNRLLYRQNRFRVDGEIVRDLALAASGLLSEKVGGPSVFPPMPPEIAALSYANNFRWTTSEGEERYRRGMYTFFKRTAPYPELMTFDCPDSNTATLQRRRSNTPLQALTLLNNEVYVEAAQAFARRVLREADTDAARLTRAVRLAIARPPTDAELDRLADLLETSRHYYAGADAAEARKMAGQPGAAADEDADVITAELAAWTATIRVLLNLDEFITRPRASARRCSWQTRGRRANPPRQQIRGNAMHPIEQHIAQSRREFLTTTASGLGLLALGSTLTDDGVLTPATAQAASQSSLIKPLAPKPPHFAPRAKRCIFLFMGGGPSHVDLFDPKPKLNELDGQPLPDSMLEGVRFAFIQKDGAKLMGSPRKFKRHGQSGMELSDLLPNIATCADDLCLIRSMQTDEFNHHPGKLQMQCGLGRFGLPTMGAWLTYGLGTPAQDLPGYVVLTAGRGNSAGTTLWQSGFLPSIYAGVLFRSEGDPVLNLSNPPGLPEELQREGLDTLRQFNATQYQAVRDDEIASRIANYELAYRMQAAAPELIDLSTESDATLQAYGVDRADLDIGNAHRGGGPGQYRSFATNCLLARRLVERGVRFVNCVHASWDHHSNLDRELAFNSGMADQPVAALIKDLKQRGLLEDTLVVFAGEFGRTPLGENRPGFSEVSGRDHHPFAFSLFMAGGGVKGGTVYGETDEIGWNVVKDPMHIHDFHATLLHLFGMDHLRLTHRFQGRDFRLTDVHGNVVHDIIA